MNKRSIRDLDVKGKTVFCRVDFNVPMENGKVSDMTRIHATIPTIQYLMDQGAKVILASHLGRPKGKVVPELSLSPMIPILNELLHKEVNMMKEVYGEDTKRAVAEMKEGDVVLLENVRFHPGEEANDEELSKNIASLADYYVNDAFGCAHRAHASTEGIARQLPSATGFLMEKELAILGRAMTNPERPFTAIIGGAKVKDKIEVIDNLLDKVDNLIIGGGLAYTFIKAKGYEIGSSLLEEDKIDLANSFMKKAEEKGVKFYTPIDAVVADSFSKDAKAKVVTIDQMPKGWQGLDIGPETVALYKEVIQSSQLVIWNGPMGVFEFPAFAEGTKGVSEALAEAENTYSIIGGGDSAHAVEMFGLSDKMDHISTGGGASLEYIEGKVLPGIAAIDDK